MRTAQETAIELITAAVNENGQPVDTETMYRDMLNECYSFASVGGPFAHMQPATVLESEDPTAYRCGKVDYLDSCELYEFGSESYNKDNLEEIREEVKDALDSEIKDMERDLEELEEELADELGSEDPKEGDEARLQEGIDFLKDSLIEKQAILEAVNAYTF